MHVCFQAEDSHASSSVKRLRILVALLLFIFVLCLGLSLGLGLGLGLRGSHGSSSDGTQTVQLLPLIQQTTKPLPIASKLLSAPSQYSVTETVNLANEVKTALEDVSGI